MNHARILLWMLTVILLFAIVLSSGCELVRTRTILVPSGEPVQLAEPINAYIYVKVEGRREKSTHRVTLPEGWWCLPDPGE